MLFDKSLWDDSDPTYAPCIKHRKDRGSYFWRPPKKYLDAGYAIKTYKLEGTAGDGRDMERARHCRLLTREMLDWFEGETNGRKPGTWGWLIGRYVSDEYSSIQEVQPSTRKKYKEWMKRIENAIGEVLIDQTDFERMMGWRKNMQGNGRSVDYISRWFTHFMIVVSHGIKAGDPDTQSHCVRIKTIRGEMRIQSPAARSQAITWDQVETVVAEADKRGWPQLALSVLLRFEFMLRGVDVYGEWEPAEGGRGGVLFEHKGTVKRWVKGLTWEMIASDVSSFEKVISKTAKSLPEPYTFDLNDVPDIRRRLLSIPEAERVGPVIKMDDGLPPRSEKLTKQFKAIVRDHPDLSDELRLSDNRSGGITESKDLVEPMTLRDAAQHKMVSTTDRYVRARSAAANKVVSLRQKNRQ
ncbi:hypothetical protein [Ruegeria sp. EL01]|uniref:hypothetical protein n=1 Tax=Ruegeria sp. EL01 TaxID=2107578 RepID=UPI000EA83787|nr:hypothetical protein [Ruegeria sp. EL01]